MWVWSQHLEDTKISSGGITGESAKVCTSENSLLYGSCLSLMGGGGGGVNGKRVYIWSLVSAHNEHAYYCKWRSEWIQKKTAQHACMQCV